MPYLENPDLLLQETGNCQRLTHLRPTECGRQQAIQIRPDNSNGMVSPSTGLPDDMQQVMPTSGRPTRFSNK